MNTLSPQQIQKISDYLFLPDSQDLKADLAMVFGTRLSEFPVAKAYYLYKNNFVPKILVSGGINKYDGENEAQKIITELLGLRVDHNDIRAELESTNTLENVVFSLQLLKALCLLDTIKTVIAVVKNFHSRRVLMTLKKHFPRGTVLKSFSYDFTPADGSSDFWITKNTWYQDEATTKKVNAEYEKIQIYLAQGDIAEI